MVKNKYIQLGVRLAILGVLLYGMLMSLGFADGARPNWYVFYTNLSNYFCVFVVIAEIVFNLISIFSHKKVESKKVLPAIRFCALIGITVTFIVLNFLLDSPFRVEYWKYAENVLMHMVNPILFWIDWLLFAEHGNTKWPYPLYSVIFPLVYVAYIFVRASIVKGNAEIIYPYFFLDANTLGVGGVIGWLAILVAGFVALGYVIFVFDNLKNFIEKRKKEKEIGNEEGE